MDEKECLKVADSDPNNISILDMEGNEIIFLKYLDNTKFGGMYCKVTFLDQKLTFTSKSYMFTKTLLLKKLVLDKTLENCKLNSTKVEKIVLKYDENVESK
ncbi:MAG: hypothetical protein EXR21_01605 [Flavobacteriaceae bacterium]|nr:hypothetical protein [Flavobacteriaceae bacterium]